MVIFWNFTLYSFLGFLLEVAYAHATGGRPNRKCLRVLPLCPVYGIGACLILFFSALAKEYPPALFFLGAFTAMSLKRAKVCMAFAWADARTWA